MLNTIWMGLIFLSVFISFFTGKTDAVIAAVTSDAKFAFEMALGITGIMAFWLGIMKIAEDSGLVMLFARAIRPLLRFLFPDVPEEHPAMGSIVMNMAANMLGLVNAATPFGLKAMEELEQLNDRPGTATNAMCTFLAINTSSVQLIPTTAIAFLAAAGAKEPTAIIATTVLATLCSTVAAITAVKLFEKLPRYRLAKAANP